MKYGLTSVLLILAMAWPLAASAQRPSLGAMGGDQLRTRDRDCLRDGTGVNCPCSSASTSATTPTRATRQGNPGNQTKTQNRSENQNRNETQTQTQTQNRVRRTQR